MNARRYWLSLRTWAGLVPMASHWMPRIVWTENGEERDVDIRPKRSKEHAFTKRASAVTAVLKWFDENTSWGCILTVGSRSTLDPQEILAGPARVKREANALWKKFEKYDGWNAPRPQWPEVQKICDAWEAALKAHWSRLHKKTKSKMTEVADGDV